MRAALFIALLVGATAASAFEVELQIALPRGASANDVEAQVEDMLQDVTLMQQQMMQSLDALPFEQFETPSMEQVDITMEKMKELPMLRNLPPLPPAAMAVLGQEMGQLVQLEQQVEQEEMPPSDPEEDEQNFTLEAPSPPPVLNFLDAIPVNPVHPEQEEMTCQQLLDATAAACVFEDSDGVEHSFCADPEGGADGGPVHPVMLVDRSADGSDAEVEYGANVALPCLMAVAAARERLEGCGTTVVTEEAGLRGFKPTFAAQLRLLEDENICACGGVVGRGRLAEVLGLGCRFNPILAGVTLLLFVLCLVLMHRAVFACLEKRAARRAANGGRRGSRCCRCLVAWPLACFALNFVSVAIMCMGPLVLSVLAVAFLCGRIRARTRARAGAHAPVVPVVMRRIALTKKDGEEEHCEVKGVAVEKDVEKNVEVKGVAVEEDPSEPQAVVIGHVVEEE